MTEVYVSKNVYIMLISCKIK